MSIKHIKRDLILNHHFSPIYTQKFLYYLLCTQFPSNPTNPPPPLSVPVDFGIDVHIYIIFKISSRINYLMLCYVGINGCRARETFFWTGTSHDVKQFVRRKMRHRLYLLMEKCLSSSHLCLRQWTFFVYKEWK